MAVAGAAQQGGARWSMSALWGGFMIERLLGVFLAAAWYLQEQHGVTGGWHGVGRGR